MSTFHFLLSPYGGPEKANYQHACVVLGEGFRALTIPFTANIDYYPDPSGTYLFNKGEPSSTSYLVTSAPEEFAAFIQASPQKLLVLDTKDEWIRPKSTEFIQQAHRYFMSSCTNPSSVVKPYCFGASNRILTATAAPPLPWKSRSSKIVWAHRVGNHALRNYTQQYYNKTKAPISSYLDNFVKPADPAALHEWQNTGRRHSPAYFEFLRHHKYLDAHGGYPTQSRQRIVQWDSWKLWEGFLSGNLVITADLDYYNIVLPFPLTPYKHYIPIRYDTMEKSYEKFFSLPDIEKEAIARQGREFVRTHYNPESIAKYVLSQLD